MVIVGMLPAAVNLYNGTTGRLGFDIQLDAASHLSHPELHTQYC